MNNGQRSGNTPQAKGRTEKRKVRQINIFIEITLRHECSLVNLLNIFRKPSPSNIPGWLLLKLSFFVMPTDQNILTTFCSTIQVTKVNFEFRNSSKVDQFP